MDVVDSVIIVVSSQTNIFFGCVCVYVRILFLFSPHMGVIALAVIVAVMGIGYIIFRGANGQKDAFRRDPNHPSVKRTLFPANHYPTNTNCVARGVPLCPCSTIFDDVVTDINYINTERGTRLMISGWWGIARHINYLGDWVSRLCPKTVILH